MKQFLIGCLLTLSFLLVCVSCGMMEVVTIDDVDLTKSDKITIASTVPGGSVYTTEDPAIVSELADAVSASQFKFTTTDIDLKSVYTITFLSNNNVLYSFSIDSNKICWIDSATQDHYKLKNNVLSYYRVSQLYQEGTAE